MIDITFRIPSKGVQYGYAEVKYETDHVPEPEDLAVEYSDYINRFQKAEMAAKPKMIDSRLAGDAFAVGDTTTVGGIRFSKIGEDPFDDRQDDINYSPDPSITSDADDNDVPPATPPSDEEVKDLVRSLLGGSVVSETPAPWDGKGKVPSNLEPKPWQKGARKAPVASLFD